MGSRGARLSRGSIVSASAGSPGIPGAKPGSASGGGGTSSSVWRANSRSFSAGIPEASASAANRRSRSRPTKASTWPLSVPDQTVSRATLLPAWVLMFCSISRNSRARELCRTQCDATATDTATSASSASMISAVRRLRREL